MMVFAVAAVALDLLVGYAGLISFGHAAFIGLGAYAVGILSSHGIGDALDCVAGRHRLVDAVCMAHRNCLPADQRRVFHHDHARLRPDGVFRRHVACPLRRRQRADHCGAQYHRWMAAAQERPGILLFHLPLPAGDISVLPRAGRIALRPRVARHQGERDQHGDDRLRCAPISAPCLCRSPAGSAVSPDFFLRI